MLLNQGTRVGGLEKLDLRGAGSTGVVRVWNESVRVGGLDPSSEAKVENLRTRPAVGLPRPGTRGRLQAPS